MGSCKEEFPSSEEVTLLALLYNHILNSALEVFFTCREDHNRQFQLVFSDSNTRISALKVFLGAHEMRAGLLVAHLSTEKQNSDHRWQEKNKPDNKIE